MVSGGDGDDVSLLPPLSVEVVLSDMPLLYFANVATTTGSDVFRQLIWVFDTC